jgi:hypothetical protein
METQPPSNTNDHDLLIEIKTNLSNLTGEMKLLRDDTKDRLSNVEKNKVERSDFIEYKNDNDRKVDSKLDKTEFIEYKTSTDKIIADKLDTKDFTPIKNVLVRINWILIATVVIALLALITHVGHGGVTIG